MSTLKAAADKGFAFLKSEFVKLEDPATRAKLEAELVSDAQVCATWVAPTSQLGKALAAFHAIMAEVESVDSTVVAPAQTATGIGVTPTT